ncbi:MAG: hypothetical protein IKT14_05940 [Clostridiales bacterium]|nr:hypothetical protein [Clostridiales bacterium]
MTSDKREIDRKSFFRALICALLSLLSFNLSLDFQAIEGSAITKFGYNALTSFKGFSIEHLILFAGLFLLYLFTGKTVEGSKKAELTVIIPALLFSFFMVFGYSYESKNSWELAVGIKNGQSLKAAIVFTGFFILFNRLLKITYLWLDPETGFPKISLSKGKSISKGPLAWYLRKLEDHPFLTVFATLMIIYIPHMIISYPACFMGDTDNQIRQCFSELRDPTMDYLRHDPSLLLSEDVFINNHHPVAHSLLIHVFLLFSDAVFGSFNVGIFMVAVLQEILFMATIAYGFTVVLKDKLATAKYGILVILYSFLHPHIHSFIFLITKDMFYGICFLLLMISSYEWITKGKSKRVITLMTIACTGIILFRNDGRYSLLLFFIVAAIFLKPVRKQSICFAVYVLLFSSFIFNFLYPHLYFTPGSRREMLSVPFQQTARYIREYGDEVTDEEREAIDAVLKYDVLADKYNPDKSDNVKATFRDKATSEELSAYFKVWGQMLLKHPGVYVEATMNNYYQYFYPGTVRYMIYSYAHSEARIDETNEWLEPIGKSFDSPEATDRIRKAYDYFDAGYREFPVVSFFVTPAVYVWCIIILLCYVIRKRNRQSVVLMTLPLLVFLICLVGPCNGYYGRYAFPVVTAIPLLIPMIRGLTSDRPSGKRS